MKRKRLYFTRPFQIEVREEPVPAPGKGELLVATRFSAVSAGTEMLVFKGRFPEHMAVDETLPALSGAFRYPLTYGYACVGRVEAAGDPGNRWWIGRHVFAFHPHDSHFTTPPDRLLALPEGLDPWDAAFTAGMETAVNLVLDGRPLIGERVAVFGLGVIGILVTALLVRHPLAMLAALDPLALRRDAAARLAADLDRPMVLNTLWPPSLPEDLTDNKCDLVYELSGQPDTLNAAIQWAGFDARIVVGSWYGNKPAAVDLGGRFHRDRIRIVSSQVSTLSPRLSGRWTFKRRLEAVFHWLGILRPSGLITHRFDIDQAQQAYERIAGQPGDTLQVVLTYPQ